MGKSRPTWKKKWPPTPVLLPRKSHGWRTLMSMGSQTVGHNWATSLHLISCPTLQPRGLQHARLLCCLLTPRVCSNSCPSCPWCHPTISSSVTHFSSCLQPFPASGSFPMSQLFPSGGQSIVASASASVLPMNLQGWFPLGWAGWICLQSKGLSRVFSNTKAQKHQFFSAQPSYGPTLTSLHNC